MSDPDTKFCPHCHAQYHTILNNCVYCKSHLRPVQGPFSNPEIFFVVVNLTAILLYVLVALK